MPRQRAGRARFESRARTASVDDDIERLVVAVIENDRANGAEGREWRLTWAARHAGQSAILLFDLNATGAFVTDERDLSRTGMSRAAPCG